MVAEQSTEADRLVAPIALYPDALVAQILAAATCPTEVVEGDRWMQQHPDLKGDAFAQAVDSQSWDPGVKALTQFPSVLAMMDKNLSWTSSPGDAYVNRQQNVLDAVQVMRQRAQQAGNLKSTHPSAGDPARVSVTLALEQVVERKCNSFAGAGCREPPDWALHPVDPAVGCHRVNRVVVRCPRRKPIHAYAKDGIGMTPVQTDVGFRCLAEFPGARTIMHYPVVLVRSSGVVASPPDNGRIAVGHFERWSLRDAHVRRLRGRSKLLLGTVRV